MQKGYFTTGEKLLWGISTVAVLLSFWLFGGGGWLTLAASLIGVTSLIFNAKGNPFGQLLMVLFSLMYGVISWQERNNGILRCKMRIR
jgi:nicotinamide riboside transporter PnuC